MIFDLASCKEEKFFFHCLIVRCPLLRNPVHWSTSPNLKIERARQLHGFSFGTHRCLCVDFISFSYFLGETDGIRIRFDSDVATRYLWVLVLTDGQLFCSACCLLFVFLVHCLPIYIVICLLCRDGWTHSKRSRNRFEVSPLSCLRRSAGSVMLRTFPLKFRDFTAEASFTSM